MGLDVRIGVEGAEWDGQHPLADKVRDQIGRDLETWIGRTESGWLQIDSMERYWGPTYQRGSWPRIYGALRALGAMYPGARITYGADGSEVEFNLDATPELLAAYWDYWLLNPDLGYAPKESE